MPYWSIYCLYRRGYIADALLECLPAAKKSTAVYRLLFQAKTGAAIACPYCDGLLGFDDSGQPQAPRPGWPAFRYGRAELEIKKRADGEPPDVSLEARTLRHRVTRPGHIPPSTATPMPNERPR
jgi:hypothetical protein